MKKLITSIIMASLFVTLTACGGNKADVTANTNEPAKVTTNANGLIEDGKLYVATSPDYAPFEYLEGTKIVGFDIELLNAVAAKNDIEVVFSPLSFETIILAVQNGQYDVGMSAFTKTPEREKEVLFSTPYYISSQVALLPLDSTVTTNEDLVGKKIGAGMGTTGEAAAKTLSDNVPPLDTSTAFPMLQAGQLDAYVCDYGVAYNAVATGKYKMLDTPISQEETAMIFKSDNTALADLLNKSLEEYMASSEYQDLLAKYNLN